MLRFSLCSVVCLLLATNLWASPKVTIEAGDFDRHHCIVAAAIPKSTAKWNFLIRDDGSQGLPIQIDGDKAWFIIPKLLKGSKEKYELKRLSEFNVSNRVEIVREGRKLKMFCMQYQEKYPLLEYQAEAGELPRDNIRELFTRGGYIHPVLSPAGKMVTDDFPPNHIHHHGVWWSWTKTEFQGRHPDFWNMGDGKGRVNFVSVGEAISGPVFAQFSAKHRFVDLTAKPPVAALDEVWQVTVYNTLDAKRGWIFDLVSTQQCATNAPLKLPEYRYGGIGIRGNRAWNGKGKTDWLTSEGKVTSDQGMRGRWCDMSGMIDGARAGMTILCSPSNFRAPQPMRIHPTEPFFCFAPQEAGDMEIAPGTKYVSRYRFIVHDGEPDKEFIESVWNDYAHPPKVTVSDE
jgi:hypothetical protein